jgi:hypothetical protein
MAQGPRELLTNLLTGYGYNLYDKKNRARADDLLVREKAAERIADAANAIRSLRTAYVRRYIPTATRESPDPPPERAAQVRVLKSINDQLADLDTRIRSMSVPTQDRMWEHFRSELSLLNQLILFDYNLISSCQQVSDMASALAPADWNDDSADELTRAIDAVEKAIRGRREFLAIPS